MPTNSNYDRYFTGVGDVPIFTYGMITITSIVLAYMTYMDPSISEDIKEPILEATSMDEVIDSTTMDNTVALPEPEEPIYEEPLQEQQTLEEEQLPQEPIPEEPIQEEQAIKEPVAGGKRRNRSTRRSKPSGKKH